MGVALGIGEGVADVGGAALAVQDAAARTSTITTTATAGGFFTVLSFPWPGFSLVHPAGSCQYVEAFSAWAGRGSNESG